MNSSFIILIPKVEHPSHIKDFRPITLINCSLKVLSKILTTRLSSVIDKVIGPTQSWFIRGRKISGGILITNEIVLSIKNKEVEGMILNWIFRRHLILLIEIFYLILLKVWDFKKSESFGLSPSSLL